MFRSIHCSVLGLVVWILLCRSVAAQPSMTVTRIANFNFPVAATTAPGDSDRMFIVRQGSSNNFVPNIRIVNLKTGIANPNPFLSISNVACCNERGLLGLAFHPDYQNNGRFYVNFTAMGQPLVTTIREYTRSNPDLADPNSGRTLLTINQPGPNHNGGWMAFGPDGYLYIATGDGTVADNDNAQTVTNNLLGKILRIDPLGNNSSNGQYGIPSDNPFVGLVGDDEIWSYGLRNPWRASFDRQTGDLYIADVGGQEREEVNIQPAGSKGGQNYGWDVREGTMGDPLPGAIDPFYEYTHGFGPFQGFAIIGGYVYRGPIAAIQGHYFFADNRTSRLWSMKWDGSDPSGHNGTNFTDLIDWTDIVSVDIGPFTDFASFGEDSEGNLYIVSHAGGIYRVVSASLQSGAFSPNSFSAFRGVYVSGDLSSVLASDNVDLCYNPGITLFPTEAPVTIDFIGTSPDAAPASISLVIESTANTVGLGLTFRMWNFNTSSWQTVGTANQTNNIDTVRTVSGVPADHVEVGTGEVRARYEVRKQSFVFLFPWTDCIDHVFWTPM